MSKILIVEDDKTLREECKIFLVKYGYEVDMITSFENTKDAILMSDANLVLMDINIPGKSGEHLCREIREVSDVPIIMLTSSTNEMDELMSISFGADDYITKPYNPQILLVRIEAVLKRANPKEETTVSYLGMVINTSKSVLEYKEKVINLSRNEMKILYYFFKHHGRIISRDEIMDYLWGHEEFVDDNTLSVNVNRIRKKMESLGFDELIETKRGQGYLVE